MNHLDVMVQRRLVGDLAKLMAAEAMASDDQEARIDELTQQLAELALDDALEDPLSEAQALLGDDNDALSEAQLETIIVAPLADALHTQEAVEHATSEATRRDEDEDEDTGAVRDVATEDTPVITEAWDSSGLGEQVKSPTEGRPLRESVRSASRRHGTGVHAGRPVAESPKAADSHPAYSDPVLGPVLSRIATAASALLNTWAPFILAEGPSLLASVSSPPPAAAVQLKASSARPTTTPSEIKAIAAAGLGSGGSSPWMALLQVLFGRYDLSGIRIHDDETAQRAAEALGATAYAMGDDIVLGRDADLATLAHEVAHVLQQRAGLRPAGGVGSPGDALERMADEVADRIARQEPVEDLLDLMLGQPAPQPESPDVSSPAAIRDVHAADSLADEPVETQAMWRLIHRNDADAIYDRYAEDGVSVTEVIDISPAPVADSVDAAPITVDLGSVSGEDVQLKAMDWGLASSHHGERAPQLGQGALDDRLDAADDATPHTQAAAHDVDHADDALEVPKAVLDYRQSTRQGRDTDQSDMPLALIDRWTEGVVHARTGAARREALQHLVRAISTWLRLQGPVDTDVHVARGPLMGLREAALAALEGRPPADIRIQQRTTLPDATVLEDRYTEPEPQPEVEEDTDAEAREDVEPPSPSAPDESLAIDDTPPDLVGSPDTEVPALEPVPMALPPALENPGTTGLDTRLSSDTSIPLTVPEGAEAAFEAQVGVAPRDLRAENNAILGAFVDHTKTLTSDVQSNITNKATMARAKGVAWAGNIRTMAAGLVAGLEGQFDAATAMVEQGRLSARTTLSTAVMATKARIKDAGDAAITKGHATIDAKIVEMEQLGAARTALLEAAYDARVGGLDRITSEYREKARKHAKKRADAYTKEAENAWTNLGKMRAQAKAKAALDVGVQAQAALTSQANTIKSKAREKRGRIADIVRGVVTAKTSYLRETKTAFQTRTLEAVTQQTTLAETLEQEGLRAIDERADDDAAVLLKQKRTFRLAFLRAGEDRATDLEETSQSFASALELASSDFAAHITECLDTLDAYLSSHTQPLPDDLQSGLDEAKTLLESMRDAFDTKADETSEAFLASLDTRAQTYIQGLTKATTEMATSVITDAAKMQANLMSLGAGQQRALEHLGKASDEMFNTMVEELTAHAVRVLDVTGKDIDKVKETVDAFVAPFEPKMREHLDKTLSELDQKITYEARKASDAVDPGWLRWVSLAAKVVVGTIIFIGVAALVTLTLPASLGATAVAAIAFGVAGAVSAVAMLATENTLLAKESSWSEYAIAAAGGFASGAIGGAAGGFAAEFASVWAQFGIEAAGTIVGGLVATGFDIWKNYVATGEAGDIAEEFKKNGIAMIPALILQAVLKFAIKPSDVLAQEINDGVADAAETIAGGTRRGGQDAVSGLNKSLDIGDIAIDFREVDAAADILADAPADLAARTLEEGTKETYDRLKGGNRDTSNATKQAANAP
ncbi:MAG: eCIS core domain-containing protein [Myxococcota bacterium]